MTRRPPASIKVLLIDDDVEQFILLQAMLASDPTCSFEVEWCSTFEEGVRRLAAADCDVALIDYRLDRRNGIDLLRHEAVQQADVAAVMLTAEAHPDVDREAMEAGAVDYLVKSEVTPQMLTRSLRYAAERRHAQLALAESEARHRSTFNDAPIGMAQTALNGDWLNVNQCLLEMLGYSRDEMLAIHFSAFTHPDDVADNSAAQAQLLSGEIDQYRAEKRYRRKDGSYIWTQLTVSPHRRADGTPEYFIAVIADLTERKKAQQELDHIFNLSPDMIATCGFDGRFTRTNPAWSEVLGYSRETLEASPFITFVHPDDQDATLAELSQLTTGKRVFGFTNRYRAADGSYRCIEWHSTVDPSSEVIYAVARDQTERRLLEAQFRQAQKMEAVGRLAGGVAHDFNNLLTAIIGFSEMVLEQLPPDGPVHEVEQILNAGRSAASLTRQLLAFSRKQTLAPTLLDVNALVSEMNSLLRRVIGEDVALEITTCDQASRICADRGQFEQVIMNLAVNARDAMPRGGSLGVTIDCVTLDEAFVAAHPGSATGHHVRLTLRDTGTGMGPEVLAHLFEPFFTTKDPGKGTGLGLATVYGIVKQSGGYISVDSTPGHGSAFLLYFPSAAGAAEKPVGAGAATPPPACNSETVLVVDDQAEVRLVTRLALEKHGYRVIEAADGRAALSLLEEDDRPVHLLLTDVVMPHMSGPELAESAAARDRSIRVLYTSGYPDDTVLRPGSLPACVDLIHKPFSHAQLLTRVRAALDRPLAAAS